MSNRSLTLKITIVSALPFLLSSLFAAGCSGCKSEPELKADLEFWSVFDDSSVYKKLISDFQKQHSNIKIKYQKKSIDTYEKDLIDALASGKGPDIFSIHNTWLPKHKDKLAVLPTQIFPYTDYENIFVDVVTQDFVGEDGKIYAIPFSVDTLVLYWNKDIFNSVGIAQPPSDWHEFVDIIPKLTEKDLSGNITRAGATIGVSDVNINRATDILSLIMMQTGVPMVKQDTKSVDFSGKNLVGAKALDFYTSFADPEKIVYTWNKNLDYSIDMFSQGRTAMIFNYAYNLPIIRAKNPHLNFAIALMPQTKDAEKKINYANYWGQAVWKNSSVSEQTAAWTFLKWMSEKDNLRKYLNTVKKPTARRDLVEEQKSDSDLTVFATQTLSATSWYQPDSALCEKYFNEMIDMVNNKILTPAEAIQWASKRISQLMK